MARLGRAFVIPLAAMLLALVVPGTAAARKPPQSYVALGDSYTAGPLIPLQETDPLGCLRSDHNYPHLVAAALGVSNFRDPSCSGAETEDMTMPQGVSPGPNPPQFDRLAADTQLVTIGIGGNDIGFSEIVENCSASMPSGHPCQDHYVVNGRDELAERIAATAPKVAAVLDGIHQRSPKARIFVVGYLAILPESGPGCWPQMPIAPDDVPYLRETEKKLNAMLAAQAAANGAKYVDTMRASSRVFGGSSRPCRRHRRRPCTRTCSACRATRRRSWRGSTSEAERVPFAQRWSLSGRVRSRTLSMARHVGGAAS
jgi:lysophospholipase L1-like esterase